MENNNLTPPESSHKINLDELNEILQKRNDELKEKEQLLIKKYHELEEKGQFLNKKNHELEILKKETIERNQDLEEKLKDYSKRIERLEEKDKHLADNIKEFEEKSKKLEEARKQFTMLSIQVEEKKIDLDKLEKNILKSKKAFEMSKFDFEKEKLALNESEIEFEKSKLEFEENTKKSLILSKSEQDKKPDSSIKKKQKGKTEILESIFNKLLDEGNFQSCFLIDAKGMLISEVSRIQLDKLAIAAMFSLIGTSVLRAVESLNLQELQYLKLASTNGEFMLKNINLTNYERNFILIAFYDKSDLFLPGLSQKINKKTIRKINKDVKQDLYAFRKEANLDWAFDNLIEKLIFLRKTYKMPESDIEITRKNLLNKVAIEIRGLFEK